MEMKMGVLRLVCDACGSDPRASEPCIVFISREFEGGFDLDSFKGDIFPLLCTAPSSSSSL
jgi:hypothetical protein